MAFSGQLSEVDSLLPPRGSWGSSSGRQVWPSQPSHPPSKTPTQALGSEFRKLTVDVDGFSTEAERGHVGAWAGGCGRNPRMVRPCSVAALFPAAASAVAVSFLQPGTRVCRSSDDAVSLMGDRHRDCICAQVPRGGSRPRRGRIQLPPRRTVCAGRPGSGEGEPALGRGAGGPGLGFHGAPQSYCGVVLGTHRADLVDGAFSVFSMGNNSYGQCGRKVVEDEVYR